MILIMMIMLMLGHLEVHSGALGGSEWGTWRLRVGHLEAQSGALAGSERGTCSDRSTGQVMLSEEGLPASGRMLGQCRTTFVILEMRVDSRVKRKPKVKHELARATRKASRARAVVHPSSIQKRIHSFDESLDLLFLGELPLLH